MEYIVMGNACIRRGPCRSETRLVEYQVYYDAPTAFRCSTLVAQPASIASSGPAINQNLGAVRGLAAGCR